MVVQLKESRLIEIFCAVVKETQFLSNWELQVGLPADVVMVVERIPFPRPFWKHSGFPSHWDYTKRLRNQPLVVCILYCRLEEASRP